MPKVQSISKSNFAWNSLRKEHHIAHVAEKKYAKWGGEVGALTTVQTVLSSYISRIYTYRSHYKLSEWLFKIWNHMPIGFKNQYFEEFRFYHHFDCLAILKSDWIEKITKTPTNLILNNFSQHEQIHKVELIIVMTLL